MEDEGVKKNSSERLEFHERYSETKDYDLVDATLVNAGLGNGFL